MKLEKILWESGMLFSESAECYYYRVLLRQINEPNKTIKSVDAEICYKDKKSGIRSEWQIIEKFSAKYGRVLQLALLELN